MIVTVAHGSRYADGNAVAAALTAQVAEQSSQPVLGAYVELCDPVFEESTTAGAPAVVVPLLLSSGYHVCRDLPERLAPGVGLTPPLGPDPVIAAVQVERLRAAGAEPGCPVTMVATGSRHPGAQRDLARACDLLARAWGGEVRLATMTGEGRRPAEVVQPGDAVSPYLLAPGHFSRSLREQSLEAGASVVAEVIGADPALARLVLDRAQGPAGLRPCELLGTCVGGGCRDAEPAA